MRSDIYRAKVQVDVWSRATGKSSDHAKRVEVLVYDMPRSKNIFEGRTFQQVLTKTLPGVIHNLEKRGYYENVQFVLNQKPPKNWPRCYEPPGNFDNTMCWHNGTMFQIISQDRSGDARGLNSDSVTADEALTLDMNTLETGSIATNRGNNDKFGHCPYHHSVRLSTSKGFGTEFKQIQNFGKYYEADGKYYRPILNKIVGLKLMMIDSQNREEQADCWKEILKLQKLIKWYPSQQGIFYNEADVFDNIKNVGWSYLLEMRKTMTDLMFQVEILNKDFEAVENGFYNIIDEEHLYDAPNNSFLESLDYDMKKIKTMTVDCRKDADLRSDLPIDIGLDYGSHINWLVSGQTYDNIDYTQNAFFVKRPKMTQDVVHAFCDYYHYHPTKEVNYPYDHTAKPTDGKSTTIYWDEVCKTFHERGWIVNPIFIGRAPAHHDKYLLSAITLKGGDPRFCKQKFNRENCKHLLLSMKQAPLKQGKDGFEKDKSSEGKLLKVGLREEATDGSDAWDTLHWWKNFFKSKNQRRFQPLTVR